MSFYTIIREKLLIHLYFLIQNSKLPHTTKVDELADKLADDCYANIKNVIDNANLTMAKLKHKYTLGVVSNFYGNIDKVLEEFDLHELYELIVDSTIVGIRKPDPEIYRLAIDKLGFTASEVAIVGDSYTNDMEPGRTLGCKTVWLKGRSWKEETQTEAADHIITKFEELENLFL
jgi:putative hydrolase of the HAD superfamily